MMAEADDLGYIAALAKSLGASEGALRLLISLLAGYPLAVFHRLFLYKTSPNAQHFFFIVTGLAIGYFNFGENVLHSLINIILCYLVILSCGGTSISVALSFLINVTYLVWGYCYTETVVYTVSWTTPQCVLTLRLTGLVFDIFDGQKKQEELSKEQSETAVKKAPSLLETAGYCYFFGGFLTGPQFPITRYQSFVNGAFSDPVTGGLPPSVMPALRRLMAGGLYTLAFQISDLFLPDSYLLTSSFQSLSFLTKCLVITAWGKLMLSKYVGCWLITEGACILTGITYNGQDENGNYLWNGCANVHIRDFEKASTGQEYIQAFNVNTNKWMGKYVFKRLKWMGDKNISQGVTLFFLALWHGLHSGYYNNFALEFIIIKFERDVNPILSRTWLVQTLRSIPAAGPALIWASKKLYAQFVLSYALVSFSLCSFSRYMQVYSEVYFVVHVVFMGWPLLYALVLAPMYHTPKQREKQQ